MGIKGLGIAALALMLGAGTMAAASTLTPTDVGGSYSTDYQSPTVVGAGYDTITGTTNGNQFIELEFSALPAGAQTLTFTFSAPASTVVQGTGGDWSYYGAGGSVLYSVGSPFAYGPWGGTTLGSYSVNNSSLSSLSQIVTLALDSSFSGGALYVGLNTTYGSNLNFSIGAPSNAVATTPVTPVSTVPLPAGVLLLGGGVALLAGLGRRSRRMPMAA